MRAAKITGIGGCLPSRIVTNKELEPILETTHEWIVQRTGIEERRWADAETGTADLGSVAALEALTQAGIDKSKIDLIVLATSSPDIDLPGGAAVLQERLNIPGVPYFDIRQACSGFVYGLALADKFIRTGEYQCVLVVGAEVQSKALDLSPAGKNVSALFGDGAGAVIVEACEVHDPQRDPHIVCTELHADGTYAKELWIRAPGCGLGPHRLTHQMIDDRWIYPEMNGRLVFTHAVTRMPEVLNSTLSKAGIPLEQVDYFFFHQANLRINQKIAEDMKIPFAKVHSTIERFGNTTAGTIPLGMWDAKNKGLLRPGQVLALTSFGAGFTWASAIIRY